MSTLFGDAGEYTDAETGFLYLRARYYDPATQQFLTVDPLLAATEQAYTYAGGSPLNGTDPSGLRVDPGTNGGGGGGAPVWYPSVGGMPTLPNPVPFIKTLIAVTTGLAAYIGTQMLGLTPQPVSQQTCYASSTKQSTTYAKAVGWSDLPYLKPGVVPEPGKRYFVPDPKKNHPDTARVRGGRGWVDAYGNIWEPALGGGQHGGKHFDVQHPGRGRGTIHTNVTDDGTVIGDDNFPNEPEGGQ